MALDPPSQNGSGDATPAHEASPETHSDTLKSMTALVWGVLLTILALALAALGQIIALAILIVAIPLAIWGAQRGKRTARQQAAEEGPRA